MDVWLLFFLGGIGYIGLELLWRGRSHIVMGVAGGFCTVLLVKLYTNVPLSLPLAYLWGLLVISSVEFLFGYVCNLKLKMNIWDYSRFQSSLYAQVCLPYSLLWGLLGVLLWLGVRFLV